ncbi:MAG: hypothetical protein Q4F97_06185 [Bacteroidales bacterium]|nr:hypothetical protein [Bacteroidales bacterium]
MKILNCFFCVNLLCVLLSCSSSKQKKEKVDNLSGIYPSLAYYNNEGECGTGAVVDWGNNLWIITYGPHLPFGSSDKLYEITPEYKIKVNSQSIGGTPANRMIHKESGQLFIGPYVIDKTGNVRTIPYYKMSGRFTGNARHLTDPENKIYYGTMEEGFYEVDVNTLDVKELYKDLNKRDDENPNNLKSHKFASLPGAHGKGLYSGQGVMIYTNNGELSDEALKRFDIPSGVLAEWNGKDWSVVRRNQFVEVTGPGGIFGNNNPQTDPIWATGWDHKSLLLAVRDPLKGWSFYRLPKASNSYDGAHGWNTEWPRIRNVGTPDSSFYLMTMHGMFWHFPESFSADNSAGLRPLSSYLKVIGDFTRWNERLVFGCDDSAQKEFLNKRKVKGNIEGPGQSNSNLWFTSFDKINNLGPTTANGAVLINEAIEANTPTEPFIFSGWEKRSCWINNIGNDNVVYSFEADKKGNNEWTVFKDVAIEPNSSQLIDFLDSEKGEWVRVLTDKPATATVSFNYTSNFKNNADKENIFEGIASIKDNNSSGALLYGRGGNKRTLGVLAYECKDNKMSEIGFYELNENLNLTAKADSQISDFIRTKFSIPKNVAAIEPSSVLIVDESGRRWRLPLGNKNYKAAIDSDVLRICREVATERDLFNCEGTFFELPAENADGFAKIRPISTHNLKINDYCSYRGLIILSGINIKKSSYNNHVIVSDDGKAAVWAGAIDDLWQMGKPVGHGGPWLGTDVKKDTYSDPYLICGYDKKELTISHKGTEKVKFTLEADPTGNNNFMVYQVFEVEPNKTFKFKFPEYFNAKWIRFKADHDVNASAILDYK